MCVNHTSAKGLASTTYGELSQLNDKTSNPLKMGQGQEETFLQGRCTFVKRAQNRGLVS